MFPWNKDDKSIQAGPENEIKKSVITNENLPGYRKKNWEDGRNLLPRKNKVKNVHSNTFVCSLVKRLTMFLKALENRVLSTCPWMPC